MNSRAQKRLTSMRLKKVLEGGGGAGQDRRSTVLWKPCLRITREVHYYDLLSCHSCKKIPALAFIYAQLGLILLYVRQEILKMAPVFNNSFLCFLEVL